MATLVSQPPPFYTALRAVEYTFNMPSIGTGSVEKLLRYRLRNVSDSMYLTDWKYYKPVANGQNIVVDFYKDMFGINTFEAPPFSLPNVIFSNTTIIKTIEVEYGERSIDKSNGCEITDTTDGTTTRIDVINGIWRQWESEFPQTGMILSNRPKLYYIGRDSADWLYVAGTYYVTAVYYDSNGMLNGSDAWVANQTFPNSVVSIIPIGFQVAPAGTVSIRVFAKQSGAPIPLGATDHYCTIRAHFNGNEESMVTDIYFSNYKGGIDLMSFDTVDTKNISTVKEYFTSRFDRNSLSPHIKGQIKVNVNNSSVDINFKKQFDRLIFKETEWLDAFCESSVAFLRMPNQAGVDQLMRGTIVDGSFQTYGDEIELTCGFRFSLERLNPV